MLPPIFPRPTKAMRMVTLLRRERVVISGQTFVSATAKLPVGETFVSATARRTRRAVHVLQRSRSAQRRVRTSAYPRPRQTGMSAPPNRAINLWCGAQEHRRGGVRRGPEEGHVSRPPRLWWKAQIVAALLGHDAAADDVGAAAALEVLGADGGAAAGPGE